MHCRACVTTSRGCRRHRTNGSWRVGRNTHSSAVSAFTAAAAAPACSRSLWWWKASTVVSAHSDRASTPPLARLREDVFVVPAQSRRRIAQSRPVGLPPVREWCVARRSRHWRAMRRISAAPDKPSCPRLHHLLRQHD
eukprot:872646-Pleurochrysis_carterae.AAC.2